MTARTPVPGEGELRLGTVRLPSGRPLWLEEDGTDHGRGDRRGPRLVFLVGLTRPISAFASLILAFTLLGFAFHTPAQPLFKIKFSPV